MVEVITWEEYEHRRANDPADLHTRARRERAIKMLQNKEMMFYASQASGLSMPKIKMRLLRMLDPGTTDDPEEEAAFFRMMEGEGVDNSITIVKFDDGPEKPSTGTETIVAKEFKLTP